MDFKELNNYNNTLVEAYNLLWDNAKIIRSASELVDSNLTSDEEKAQAQMKIYKTNGSHTDLSLKVIMLSIDKVRQEARSNGIGGSLSIQECKNYCKMALRIGSEELPLPNYKCLLGDAVAKKADELRNMFAELDGTAAFEGLCDNETLLAAFNDDRQSIANFLKAISQQDCVPDIMRKYKGHGGLDTIKAKTGSEDDRRFGLIHKMYNLLKSQGYMITATENALYHAWRKVFMD